MGGVTKEKGARVLITVVPRFPPADCQLADLEQVMRQNLRFFLIGTFGINPNPPEADRAYSFSLSRDYYVLLNQFVNVLLFYTCDLADRRQYCPARTATTSRLIPA